MGLATLLLLVQNIGAVLDLMDHLDNNKNVADNNQHVSEQLSKINQAFATRDPELLDSLFN